MTSVSTFDAAAEKGFYHSPGWNKDYQRIQILTIEEILAGKTVQMPQTLERTFKQAERMSLDNADQGALTFE